ncbi:chemotaxis protein CheA [Terasakiella pusilla]|uniref:chemotaxis protein CheA n=1 Tax=Terasakiella pusilla TaxID=64973 RepID=UPI003AA8A190
MPQDFNLEQFKVTYFEECHELLASAEEQLTLLQQELGNVDVEVLHAIFRCVHSIKGGAGAFNYTDLIDFTHSFETLLDKLREGEIPISMPLVDVLFEATDILSSLVQRAQDNQESDPEVWKKTKQKLESYLKEGGVKKTAPSDHRDGIADYDLTPEEEEEQGWGLFIDLEEDEPASELPPEPLENFKPTYKIKFVPEPHLLRFANEPLLLARELSSLGKYVAHADLSRLDDLDQINPDEAYLSWIFELETDASKGAIEEVFEFVVDDCELVIEKIGGEAATNTATTKEAQGVKAQKPEPRTARASRIRKEVELHTPAQPAPPQAAQLPDMAEDRPPVTETLNDGSKSSLKQQAKISSIRVELDRVDRLVNMVGELVISQAMLRQQVENLIPEDSHVMAQGFEDLSAHTRELQESVMAIRMQPVKSVFARIPRMVRELSARLGKKVDLITQGEMTEVDKTVIEQLMDPLTHMIRNSLDHGIETQEERAKSGKPERAAIKLSAEHRSGRIQIEVSDDGKGINRQRIVEKAVQKGLLSSDHDLSDEEIDNLIFAPGFSTADEVSDVSGRGVGMDVVRRNIVSLGGRISVFSTPGEGTRFLMSLPLTLAVLDGMIIRCGQEKYIIPLTSVIESIHPIAEELQPLVNGAMMVSMRGQYIRIVNLYKLFNIKGAVTDAAQGLVVIVETERYGHVGILVDELLGQQQVVIKSLEENYDPIDGVAAATILGNGKVALILDVDGLADMEHGSDRHRTFANLEQQVLLTGEKAHGHD